MILKILNAAVHLFHFFSSSNAGLQISSLVTLFWFDRPGQHEASDPYKLCILNWIAGAQVPLSTKFKPIIAWWFSQQSSMPTFYANILCQHYYG